MALLTLHRVVRAACLCLLLAVPATLVTGCVYRLDVQQGNLLDQTDIEAILPGMTRSQVRYLLGTPVAADPFRTDRWDYMYYLKPGKSRRTTQRWLIVWFDGEVVREVDPDVPIRKKS
ncbi:MAG: outer membrane protein assembly factor BamE [Gammaproteobacteria bacterium]|nr:outer membrane protein assembly factor BamE [Gammaproteobacteria bacterium]